MLWSVLFNLPAHKMKFKDTFEKTKTEHFFLLFYFCWTLHNVTRYLDVNEMDDETEEEKSNWMKRPSIIYIDA